MRDPNEDTITAEVISRLEDAESPRIRQIGEALIRHLHVFIREIEPSEAEWRAGIDFLTQIGQISNEKRQEFILLSDTLGVSMLVDAINHRHPKGSTETTVLGPFYVDDPEQCSLGADIANGTKGQPMIVTGTVSSAKGGSIADARVDVWHSDGDGFYDVQRSSGHAMRGRLKTDSDGRFHFWSIKPRWYPIPNDGPVGKMLKAQGRHPNRPAHIHFMIHATDHETLVTHIFEQGDPYLDSDAVFGVKESLIRPYVVSGPGIAPDGRKVNEPYAHLHYDFSLSPTQKA